MFTKFSKFVSMLMIATLLATLGAGSVLAQETNTPSDGADAVIPTGSVEIAAGTWQWYTFRSQVPVDVEEDDDAVVTDPEDATIDIALYVQSGSVGFEVWSADDLNNWRNDVDFDPTGIGTVNEFMTNDPLFWQGSFETNDTYHLIIMNRGTEAATYSLDITGNVTFPSSASPSMDTESMPAEMSAEPVISETATMTGTEGSAVIPTGSVEIAAGTWQWYTFRSQVPVDVEEDDDAVVTDPEDATIDIALYVQSGSVGFEVWSADDLNNWRNDVDFDPTGIGTVNEFMTNDPLFWQGSFETNDTYHLIIMNRGTEAATYSLDITGNVTFP